MQRRGHRVRTRACATCGLLPHTTGVGGVWRGGQGSPGGCSAMPGCGGKRDGVGGGGAPTASQVMHLKSKRKGAERPVGAFPLVGGVVQPLRLTQAMHSEIPSWTTTCELLSGVPVHAFRCSCGCCY